ncbi:unnamed protein product [Ascophyllum nodosum]
MALKRYSSDTLTGNWKEERSEPLRGVLSDLGHREYQTTHKTSFRRLPSSEPSDKRFRSNARWRLKAADIRFLMIHQQAQTVQEAERSSSVEDLDFHALSNRTRLTGSTSTPKEPETTMRAAFGVPKRVCKTMKRALRAPDGIPCGRGSKEAAIRGQSKGTKLSKPVAERFMEGEEPSHSTLAQRSWVCTQDAVVKYYKEGVPVAPPSEGLSLDVGKGPEATSVNNNRCRSITSQTISGGRAFGPISTSGPARPSNHSVSVAASAIAFTLPRLVYSARGVGVRKGGGGGQSALQILQCAVFVWGKLR